MTQSGALFLEEDGAGILVVLGEELGEFLDAVFKGGAEGLGGRDVRGFNSELELLDRFVDLCGRGRERGGG